MISFIRTSKVYQSILLKREKRIDYKNFKNKYCKQLEALKNIHKGERCFIVGNGPSLKAEDLDMLKDEICFGSNFIYKIFDKTDWRPTYYCNSDLGVLSTMLDDEDFFKFKAKKYFFQYNSRFVFNDKPYPKNSFCFYLQDASNYNKSPRFSKDIAKEIYDAFTVTYIMLQIATYMGFSKIIILGVDNNYSVSKDNAGQVQQQPVSDHFYTDTSKVKITNFSTPNTERNTMGFISAEKYARKNNIEIINATRGGKLEVFNRKSLEEVLGL